MSVASTHEFRRTRTPRIPRWAGLLGSWALLILGMGLVTIVAAAEWVNLQETERLFRLARIDRLISQRMAAEISELKTEMAETAASVNVLQSRVSGTRRIVMEERDAGQVIVVSTAENKIHLRRGEETLFEAICSTGKGTTLVHGGKTMVFDTPIGKFRIRSKEENPRWVPPDWHYVEEAQKSGMEVVYLNRESSVDADTGELFRERQAPWSWFDTAAGGTREIRVKGDTVVEISNGVERELPPGKLIVAGNKLVIPPVWTKQRQFEKVLGTHRLNLGDGYALHGTQNVDQLGRPASHGCVRLSNEDIVRLYQLVNVGDEVIIY